MDTSVINCKMCGSHVQDEGVSHATCGSTTGEERKPNGLYIVQGEKNNLYNLGTQVFDLVVKE